MLGLLATRASRGATARDPVDSALAKIHRVLPVDAAPPGRGARGDAGLHRRATGGAPVDARRVLLLADAIRRRRAAAHGLPLVLGRGVGARAQPARARRPLGPLVPRRPRPHARRPAHVPGRPDVAHGRSATARPSRRRTGSTLSRTSAAPSRACRGSGRSRCCSTSRSTRRRGGSRRRSRSSSTTADGTLLRMRVDSLDWMATVLAGLGCDFTIRRPDELRASVRALGERLAEV